MPLNPPPLPIAPATWPRQLARFSFWAPILGVIIGTQAAGAQERALKMFFGGLDMLMFVSGFLASIIALWSMLRHGRKGVLGYALTGFFIGLIFLGSTAAFFLGGGYHTLLEPYTEAELKAMPAVHAGWQPVISGNLGFRVEIPPEFTAIDGAPLAAKQLLFLYARHYQQPDAAAVVLERMGALDDGKPLPPDLLPMLQTKMESTLHAQGATDVVVKLRQLSWREEPISAIYTTYNLLGHPREICTVQVPLLREAAQLSVNLVVAKPGESLSLTQQMLDTLKGKRFVPLHSAPAH